MKLLISQKDKIFTIINNSDFFLPNQFELKEADYMGKTTTTIIYNNSNYHFTFYPDRDYSGFFLNYCPGDQQYLEATSNISWDMAETYFRIWLKNLKRETQSPNLWEKFKNEIGNVKLLSKSSNDKFTYHEYEDLIQKIEVLKLRMHSISISTEQLNEINNKLDSVVLLAKDLGRFDWTNLLIGTIVSIIIQLNVTRENANAIWEIIKEIFNNNILLSNI